MCVVWVGEEKEEGGMVYIFFNKDWSRDFVDGGKLGRGG